MYAISLYQGTKNLAVVTFSTLLTIIMMFFNWQSAIVLLYLDYLKFLPFIS
jgi:hypothetical protein